MSSVAIKNVVEMMESLPKDIQDRVAEHLREYIDELQDELKWDESFQRTQPNLVAMAKRARQEIAEGLSQPLDYALRGTPIQYIAPTEPVSQDNWEVAQ